LLWKYTLLWFGLAVIAIINGAIRNGIYSKATGELRAHQISTVSLLVLIGIFFLRCAGLDSTVQIQIKALI
jgi:hypothetical protein